METRLMGRTGLHVSALCLGAMNFGGITTEQDSIRIIHAALDAGMARLGPIVSLQLPAVELEVALGRTDRALARLDTLLARTANPAWVARRGDLLLRAGRSTEARHEYARARAMIASGNRSARGRGFAELDQRLDTTLASLTRMETRP